MAFSYASALTKPRAKAKFLSPSEYVGKYFGVIEPVNKSFKQARSAYWGDIAMYNEKDDGPLQAYIAASAKKRDADILKAVLHVPTEEEQEEERQRFKAEVERKERLREQAREQLREREKEARDKEQQCKCGCGRKVHVNPRPEFVGYCCNWCKKHNGKRGHGDSCIA